MVLKLYGSPTSTCTRRVGAVLHEKQVPFEFHSVELAKGENKSPQYLEKQPFGQIPYLDDDGFILYESRAISHYIATKYADQGTKLIPTDLKANALFQQACSIETSNFDVFASNAVYEMIFKPYKGLTPDKVVFENLIEKLNTKLDAYDKILGKQKYLAGDEVTLADLFHLPYGASLSLTGIPNPLENEARPNVVRWWKDITSRPSWEAVKKGVKSTT